MQHAESFLCGRDIHGVLPNQARRADAACCISTDSLWRLHRRPVSETLSRSKNQRIGPSMNRRDFVKTGSATLAALALEPDALTLPVPNGSSSGRLVYRINRNWRFSTQRSQNDTTPEFDDSKFEQVTI